MMASDFSLIHVSHEIMIIALQVFTIGQRANLLASLMTCSLVYRELVSCPEKRVVWGHCYFKFVVLLMRLIYSYVYDVYYFLLQL